jgi:tetratricopeptide (TPR) repeat protein
MSKIIICPICENDKSNYDKAIECFKKAIELDSNNDLAKNNLKILQAKI